MAPVTPSGAGRPRSDHLDLTTKAGADPKRAYFFSRTLVPTLAMYMLRLTERRGDARHPFSQLQKHSRDILRGCEAAITIC